jgi:hypothetical protein
MDETTQTEPWATFCDAARYHELSSISKQEGSPVPWAYLLPPHAASILFADHFWEEINLELGTLLDRAEEDELEAALSARLAQKIRQLARTRYYQGLIRKEVAWRSDGSAIWAEIHATALAELLEGLADFLTKASMQGKVIIASL